MFLFSPLSPCDRPRVIESLRGVEVVDIAAGGAHSACITASGELYTWGKGRYGRLGHGDSEDQLKPKLVSMSSCGPEVWLGFRGGKKPQNTLPECLCLFV